MPTHIAHIVKAPQAKPITKALPKSAILPSRNRVIITYKMN